METLKGILEFIRNFDYVSLLKKAALTIGGIGGWFASLVAGIVANAIKIFINKQIDKTEDKIDIDKADKAAEQKAQENTAKIQGAKTDEELKVAVRDSLK